MAINRKSSDEYRSDLESAISSRDSEAEVAYGPVKDVVTAPTAEAFSEQNKDIRHLSLVMSLLNWREMSEAELDDIAYPEVRNAGTKSRGTLYFQTSTPPTANITISVGFPAATDPNEETGEVVDFITTTSATLYVSAVSTYYNSTDDVYELPVAIEAIDAGSAGRVAAGKIKNPQRALSNFDTITNKEATIGGSDRETNEQFVTRLLLKELARQKATVYGIEKWVRDNYSDVLDVVLAYGTDPSLTRITSDAGACDAFILGSTYTTTTQSAIYDGGDLILDEQPAVSVSSIIAGATSYVEGTDFDLVEDSGDWSGTVEALDSIQWILGGTAPTLGDAILVTYTYNSLIKTLQDVIDSSTENVLGRDLLFREATEEDVVITAQVTALVGYNASTVRSNFRSSVFTYVNGLGLGDDLERFDVSSEASRDVSGLDNVVFSEFRLSSDSAGTVRDISVSKLNFVRINSVDLTVN